MNQAPTILNLATAVFFCTALPAQTEPRDETADAGNPPAMHTDVSVTSDVEIGEMIFDETITKVGRDFYEMFFSDWTNPTDFTDFNITISERPLPGIGTQITVKINDYELISQFIRPNQEYVEALAEYTVQLGHQFLLNYQEIQSQLQSEDQQGTGIY